MMHPVIRPLSSLPTQGFRRRRNVVPLGAVAEQLSLIESSGDLSVSITGVSADSRKVAPGFLFAALPGERADGHDYIHQALDRGAAALLVERPIPSLGERVRESSVLRTKDALREMGKAAAFVYGYPAAEMTFIGVTGANGKTTTAMIIEHLLLDRGVPTGAVTTVEDRWPGHSQPATYTTPRSDEYQRMLAEMLKAGVECVVSEVSSHALKMHRMTGIQADAAVFTNLTMEHRELHPTQEDYYRTKSRLFFDHLKEEGTSCVNIDDAHGRRLTAELARAGRKATRYSVTGGADVTARNIRTSPQGTEFVLVTPRGSVEVRSPLLGSYNVANQLAAVAAVEAACGTDFPLDFYADALQRFSGVPGRLERVDEGQNFLALVDYAHTPDALEKVLQTVRSCISGRLITVMGCGGSRCSEKRAPMGRIAVENSDFVLVTADNSRWEKTEDIIKDIEKGMTGYESLYLVEPDRQAAIGEAIRRAGLHDCVLLCGKGHECTQTEQGQTRHFDDRVECRKAIRAILDERRDREETRCS